jgi:hypothetical protein
MNDELVRTWKEDCAQPEWPVFRQQLEESASEKDVLTVTDVPASWANYFGTKNRVLRFLCEFEVLSGYSKGARGSVMVKALRYKSEGRGFDNRRGEFLNLLNPSGRTRPWGLRSL